MYIMAALKGDAFNIIKSPVCDENGYLQWQELETTFGTTTETDKNALIAKLTELQFPTHPRPSSRQFSGMMRLERLMQRRK